MRTNELRELIETTISSVSGLDGVYYQQAIEDALYPHAVFSFSSVDEMDLSRHDYDLDIDVWDRSTSSEVIEDICDEIEDKFDALNSPQDGILPTFYLESRIPVLDEDKTIKHRVLRIVVQNYTR